MNVMSRTKKKRIYLGVIGLCGIALLVDRLVITQGASAPAEAFADVHGPNLKPSDVGTGKKTVSIPELPFPPTLKPMDPAETIRDLFAPPDNSGSSSRAGNARGRRGTGSKGDSSPTNRQAFLAGYHLKAVLDDPRLKIAIVDGLWVRVGQTVGGCRLTKVEGIRACFACSDGEAVLTLETALGRSPD